MKIKNYSELFEDDIRIENSQAKVWISNPQFKRIHIKLINKMLEEIYKPIGHWKKYKFFGVMNLAWEKEDWSILNKINTNYTALSIMINEVNRTLREGNSEIPAFNFNDKQFGSQKFYDEYYRMMNFIDKNKQKVFLKLDKNTGSKIINKIISKIQFTSKVGDKAESLLKKYIPRLFVGLISDMNVHGSGGEKEDMVGGVDVSFKLNNIERTIQVKKVKSVRKEKGSNMYNVKGTAFSKHYEVDYLVCITSRNLVLFRYDKEKIELVSNGDVKIHPDLLLKNIKL